jgi:hypothetical protein
MEQQHLPRLWKSNIDLVDNEFGDDGAAALAKALEVNASITLTSIWEAIKLVMMEQQHLPRLWKSMRASSTSICVAMKLVMMEQEHLPRLWKSMRASLTSICVPIELVMMEQQHLPRLWKSMRASPTSQLPSCKRLPFAHLGSYIYRVPVLSSRVL